MLDFQSAELQKVRDLREALPGRVPEEAARADAAGDLNLLINDIVQALSDQARLVNASGTTSAGDPYIRVFLPHGVLLPDQSIVEKLVFKRKLFAGPVSYTVKFISGQGNP